MAARRALIAAALVCALAPATAPADTAPLSSAAAVLSLSGDQASQKLKVSVTGVVTAAEADWEGQFFVQDETGGIFVENLHQASPRPGDIVAVYGVTHPGAFAPIISSPVWRRLGTAPLPEPRQVPIEDLKTGAEDGQRVEIAGWVRTARIEQGRLLIDLDVVGNRLQVQAHPPAGVSPESLVGAQVQVRGTAVTHYIGALRHMTSVAVYAPRPEDFTIVVPEGRDPLGEPVVPINSVAQYRRERRAEQRVHVAGRVTLQHPGEEVFIEDESGGLRVVTTQAGVFRVGEPVDAVGFIEYENNLPLLRDAKLVRSGAPAAAVAPLPVTFTELAQGRHHGDLITLRGRLLDRTSRPKTGPDGAAAGLQTTWLVQGSDLTFTVESEMPAGDPGLDAIPIGSLVEVDGVCVSAVDAIGRLISVRLLLASPSGLRVLERPSWLTPSRLLAGLGLVGAGLVVAIAWLLTVAKKNAVLHRIVRELEQAQRELQEAHDTLEEKVAERSAQLQVEMTARKASELQFKAVLAERTRLARDLHDTLEQTLAGIALRLNTAAKLSRQDAEASENHLQIARNLLHQSQVGLRRSIWDLRSRELEQFDLASALRQSAEQLVDGTSIGLEFKTKGSPSGLPEVVEENVLRIGQEAITNIAKHAHAAHVSIALEFEPGILRLRVEDDGVGFEQPRSSGDGHFGLIGMEERTKRLSGSVSVRSSPGAGTSIVVEIPLKAVAGPGAAKEAAS